MIKVLFFGQLKESLKCAELELSVPTATTIAQLKSQLVEQNPSWQRWILDNQLLTAVNQILCDAEQVIEINDEVAFFPAVTGG